MIGAIVGDIIGSVYEFGRIKSKKFPLFQAERLINADFFFERPPDQPVQRYPLADRFSHGPLVEVGRYSYIKGSLIGPNKILSDRPAKLEIIFDGFFKACLELLHRTALEGNQVVDAFNPAMKTLIIRAEVYGA
jgi:hypothetical protein